ncbi:MAG: spore coat protein CotJB [Oscillospiraceae bacterium]|nr:spore coat protein CotJB [Oscillospiraceae bacterium]
MTDMTPDETSCRYKCGALPDCAPLAVGLVPPQGDAAPSYAPPKALARGTLFPGLDLPLGNVVNSGTADIPTAELMAIDFAAHDLSLYLDTHPDDTEAFETYKDLLRLAKEGMERYTRLYGPVCKIQLAESQRFNWLKGPWPWEYAGKREG